MAIQLPSYLPVGFRFQPTDVELVKFYLEPKVLGRAYDVDAIAEVDLCKLEPWELPSKSKIQMNNDRSWWFLCLRDYINQSSSRAKRSTKTGFWKITGEERTIKDEYTKACIAKKRTLVFHTGPTPGRRTNWVIHEIYLDSDSFKIPAKMPAYAICKLELKMNEKVETPGREFVPNLERQVSPPSTQSFCSLIPPVNLEMQTFDSSVMESQLTEDHSRWMLSNELEGSVIPQVNELGYMLSEEKTGSLSADHDTSEENPEDFADRCIVDESDFPNDHNDTQATVERVYFVGGLAGSDTDAEVENAWPVQINMIQLQGGSFGDLEDIQISSSLSSSSSASPIWSNSRWTLSNELEGSAIPQVDELGYMLSEEKTGSLSADHDTSKESPEDFADRCVVYESDFPYDHNDTQATIKRSYFGSGLAGSDTDAEGANARPSKRYTANCEGDYPVPGHGHFFIEDIRIPKHTSSSSSSSSASPIWSINTVKVEEPQKYVPRMLSRVYTSSLSIIGSRSFVKYWLIVVFGSVLFLIYNRQPVFLGRW